jgi:hypothetical protein
MPATTRFSDKFLVRLPEGMRDRLADAASQNRRSMTAEIVDRLQASFEAESHAAAGRTVVIDSKGGVVLHLTVTPGMTVEEVLELLAAAHMALPEETSVVMD